MAALYRRESVLKAPILLIPVVISSIPSKSIWMADWEAMLVKNSDRIEKNINSTPIRTRRSRQVSQISFNEGSGEATFEALFLNLLEFCKRKRSAQSKNDAKNGK